MKKIKLGVNIDHAATLRQVRGGHTSYPDLHQMIDLAKKGGADQITIHLREDRRHIQVKDVQEICKARKLPINLEMAVTSELLKVAKKYKPDWVCLVPEKRQELTTEGGLDVVKIKATLVTMIEKLQSYGIEVSTFIDPSVDQVRASFEAGADAIEFHTGSWVLLSGAKKEKEWQRLVAAARVAHALGLRVHAGHGLDYHHAKLIRKMPHLVEVNIGHSLICYSLVDGLKESVKKMKRHLL